MTHENPRWPIVPSGIQETQHQVSDMSAQRVAAAVADVLNFVMCPEVWAVLETLPADQQLTIVNAVAAIDDILFTAP